jgi:glycosyltransferase involved in cell wall biosynthesis
MQRICTSLSDEGFKITLVGRGMKSSSPLKNEKYKQLRLNCFFVKGKAMYLEFNLKLFFFLLFQRCDAVCAVDLDTILPCYFASAIKSTKRIYDAHELFTEQKEIITRPQIHKLWLKVEKYAVPKFRFGYTVNLFIAEELNRRYSVEYTVIKNMPLLGTETPQVKTQPPFIIYQGAVNEGRSFETLIPAMKQVNAKLVICGDGNYFKQVKSLIRKNKFEDKIELKGYVSPDELKKITPTAYVAVTLFENTGLNQYQSLANRFFDYIMAGVPQVCVGYPEYEAINDKYHIAYLIYNTNTDTIAAALNNLMNDDVLYNNLRKNCLKARKELNWQSEEKVLINFYNNVFEIK